MTDPYPSPGQWRISDADRTPYNDRLRRAVDDGRLNLVEYDQRLQQVERAQKMDELDRVVADLPLPAEAVLVQIGEIAITQSTVFTPVGPIPVRGSTWTVHDQFQVMRKTPTWAIVLAVVGAVLGVILAFCTFGISLLLLLCLLFLIAKEETYQGRVQVMVMNGPRQYAAYLPVQSQMQVQQLHQQVNYVRTLAVPR